MKSIATLFSIFFILEFSQAQVFVNQNASGANDGSSWANAFTDFQDALDAAVSGAQVWIAQGKYVPQGPTPDSSHFLATKPVELYGGFTGSETALSQRDWNAFPTIISGDILGDDIPGDFTTNRTDNAHHVLIINAPETESIIDGLVFESGSARLDAYAATAVDIPYNRWSGGALYLYQSGALIRNCLFHNNAAFRGSGCFAFGDTLHTISLQFDHVIFRDNYGSNGPGGFLQAYQDLSFKNCLFSNNSGFQGGAVFFSGTNAMVEDCVFESNSASYGGAINGFHSSAFIRYPSIQINRSTFTGNTSSSTGGGIYYSNTYGGFSFVADSCTFTENESDFIGGGLVIWDRVDALPNDAKSHISVINSTFTANVAVYGGGADIEAWDDSTQVEIINTHFVDNVADQAGGLWLAFSDAAIANCVLRGDEFRGNMALRGGGLLIDLYENTFPLHYLLEDCLIVDNVSEVGGGGLMVRSFTQPGGIVGTIRNTEFLSNHGVSTGGAIYSWQQNLSIEDSYFVANSTEAALDSSYHGGGAITIDGPAEVSIKRNIFEGNISLTDGAAITVNADVNGSIDNNLFHHQEGNSTIYNNSVLNLMNNTMADNDNGLFLQNLSSTTIQNSIFNNNGDNLKWTGKPTVVSNGGNLSSDASMIDFLIGSGSFQDFNDTDPLLGVDYYPMAGSPAIDAGNPQGVIAPTDLGGNPRIMGGGIDIGSYESFTVATHHALADDIRLKVSPNPVVDVVQISFDKEIESLRLMAMDGAIIEVGQKSIASKQINIHDFVPGVYILWLKSENKWYSARFSKI